MTDSAGAIRASLFALAVVVAPVVAAAQQDPTVAAAPTDPNEGLLGQFSARLAYNSEWGPILGLGFTSNRFLGQNQKFSFSGEVSKDSSRYAFAYDNPDMFGTNPAFSLGIYRNATQANDIFTFDTVSYGIEPRATWQLSADRSLTVFAGWSRDTVENLVAGGSAILAADLGDRTRGALGLRFRQQFEGGSFAFSTEYDSASDDSRFVKSLASLSYRWQPDGGAVVIDSGVKAGTIAMSQGNSNVGDRFFLGADAVRGFAFGGFGPRDLNAGNAALGGNNYVAARIDAYFPKLFSQVDWFIPGVFLDVGSLWGLDNVNGGPAGANPVDDSQIWRSSVGLSMQFHVGPGALRVFVANPINPQSYDQTQNVQVTFDARF
ncbi:MAG: BamA/TamA family outer membrane protein [Limimaricola sp.]|uniref:BamA/TamA family outer membrane protein n=1 Tax=Limimaricola sp. TaxID=2211665 RepID=UPI001D1D5FA0|nr:BamA/TamA family outer membrane protein [Limimaricola sp.]MBI1417664.1 BamA/TamA family outer membrane protein [Limimaricola sp.]